MAAFDDEQAKRARSVGAKVGALIETHEIEGLALPFDSDQFDMVVVDDTNGAFGKIDETTRVAYLRDARRTVRHGGRIEVVEARGGARARLRRLTRFDGGRLQAGARACGDGRPAVSRRTKGKTNDE